MDTDHASEHNYKGDCACTRTNEENGMPQFLSGWLQVPCETEVVKKKKTIGSCTAQYNMLLFWAKTIMRDSQF